MRVSSELVSGQNDLMDGNMKAIPAIAAYESWKLIELIEDGSAASWSSKAMSNT